MLFLGADYIEAAFPGERTIKLTGFYPNPQPLAITKQRRRMALNHSPPAQEVCVIELLEQGHASAIRGAAPDHVGIFPNYLRNDFATGNDSCFGKRHPLFNVS